MCDNMKIANAKDHLKQVTFKSIINQKHYTRQHQWRKMLHDEVLKLLRKQLNLNAKGFCKMRNNSVDAKVLHFLQDVVVNSAIEIKSYFPASSCYEIRKIKEMFLTNVQPNDPESCNWITNHAAKQTIDQTSKAMLLLKLCFAHWLSIESAENIQRLHKSMTCR